MRLIAFIKKVIDTLSFLKKAYAPYKTQILILAGIGFASGLLEGIGVNVLIPLFSLIAGNSAEGSNFITKAIENSFSYLKIDFAVKYLLILIAVLFIIKAILIFLGKYTQNFISTKHSEKMRNVLFKETLEAEWRYLMNQKVGYFSTVLMIETQATARLLGTINAVVLTMTTISVYVAMAMIISWQATLATFGFGIALIIGSKSFIDGARRAALENLQVVKSAMHFINETTIGAKSIKASLSAPFLEQHAAEYFKKISALVLRKFAYKSILGSSIQPISVIFIGAIFALLYKSHGFNIGSFVVLVYLIQRIFTYIHQLDSDIHNINEDIPYLRSVVKYREKTFAHKEKCDASSPFVFNTMFELQDVSFSFHEKRPLLSGVNLCIKKNAMVGIIGPSGSGKTTMVDLMLRLLEPQTGAILIDGKNTRDISLKEWRHNVGYVSQDIYMANDTILNNIAFYNPFVTEEQIKEAARQANIYDFITTLPNGFLTEVGERGVRLSAGQRQRVAIAREFVRKPQILILDEATSALDNESERAIQIAIEELRKDVTVIIVAHRLSTLFNCDTVFTLKEGRIVEAGSSRELLDNKNSYFTRMYKSPLQERHKES